MPVLKEVLVTNKQAMESREERCRHAYATEMRPKNLSGDCVVGLFKVNESSEQPGRVAWLNGAGSMLQVPKGKHGLLSALAWVKPKCVSGILLF